MGASLPTQIKACFNAAETSKFTFRSTKTFKVTPSDEQVMLAVFWDSQGALLAHLRNMVKM
jgi:hypothetical protein